MKNPVTYLPLLLLLCTPAIAQRVEKVPLGDFEQWVERHITESAILGGETKTIYAVAPEAVIDKNEAFDYSGTLWATSNAYAVVVGITKTSCSVSPDKGPSGKCARLENCFAFCKVAGIVNIRVLAAGSLIWGKMREPVVGLANPYSYHDWGIPFTERPKALILDYKALINNTGILTKGTTFKTETFPGYDPAEAFLLLQNRWEDAQGNIHASRVGTAWLRIPSTTDAWVFDERIPVIYGDARKNASFQPYMDLLVNGSAPLNAVNSKGRSKVIREEEWADADCPVTHAVLVISSGSREAYVGELGNVLWVDNVRLEYE